MAKRLCWIPTWQELYGIEIRSLLQAVRRNSNRFPADFVFQVNEDEWKSLRSQIVTSKGRGGRRYLPFVFTEHGAIMAATVLNSPLAVRNEAIPETERKGT